MFYCSDIYAGAMEGQVDEGSGFSPGLPQQVTENAMKGHPHLSPLRLQRMLWRRNHTPFPSANVPLSTPLTGRPLHSVLGSDHLITV